jgi:hypothetical protein
MRKVIFALVFVGVFDPTSFASAQPSTAPATGWAAVEAMNVGTSVHVIGRSHSTICKLAKVDDSSLTCMGIGTTQGEVFPKADIKKIKLPRRGTSTLVGTLIGVGVGAGVGAGIGAGQSSGGSIGITKGQATGIFVAIGAVVLGLIGALVGALTDFMGTTIFKG